MGAPMSAGDRRSTDTQAGRRFKSAGQVVDYGIGRLELPGAAEQAAELVDFVDGAAEPAYASKQGRGRSLVRRAFGFIGWTIRSLFGIVSLVLMLAVVAAIPIVNFLALGYLLEVEGRVARSGRLRDAFPLVDLAPRLGSMVLGMLLWLVPLRLLAGAAADARLIEAGSRSDV